MTVELANDNNVAGNHQGIKVSISSLRLICQAVLLLAAAASTATLQLSHGI